MSFVLDVELKTRIFLPMRLVFRFAFILSGSSSSLGITLSTGDRAGNIRVSGLISQWPDFFALSF
jgi:hypothetical protein